MTQATARYATSDIGDAVVTASLARKLFENAIEWFLFLCAAISILTTIGIIGILTFESYRFFDHVSIREFLTDLEWTPLFANKHFGILPLVMGTLMTAGIALTVAIPLGILFAIYLSEFATPSLRRWLKPMLEILAGIPTVVFGYFALIFVTPLLQTVVPELAGFNALSAGVVMGFMLVPTICSLSEDALFAVPIAIKEASYALGARKIVTIFRVLLPSARSGIGAAIALGVGRAVGETMIVAIAAGQRPTLTFDPRVPIETMTAFIVQVSMGDTPHGTLEYQSIFVVGGSLFLMTFMIHLLSLYAFKRK